MKTYTLKQVQYKLIGKIGTPNRDKFENEFKMEKSRNTIKKNARTIR